MDRQTFTMSQEQFDALIKESAPVPYLVMGGRPPMSVQERMNAAWDRLGDEMGFIGSSARGTGSGNARMFSAIPKEKKRDVSSPSSSPAQASPEPTSVPMAAYFREPADPPAAPAYQSGGGGDFSGGGASGSYSSDSSSSGGGDGGSSSGGSD